MRGTTLLATAGPCYQEVDCMPQIITALVVLKKKNSLRLARPALLAGWLPSF